MTVKGGRFINLGTKSYSIEELDKELESGRAKRDADAVMRSATVFVNAFNKLLGELASNQIKRRGDSPDHDFDNYEAIITPDKSKTINGKKRIISVDVKVVRKDRSTDFNLFNLLDAGYPKKRVASGKPMTFPMYSGNLVKSGSRQEAISIGKVKMDDPVRWFKGRVVGPLPARNFYSRIRNALTPEARRVASLVRAGGLTREQLAEKYKNQKEINFYAKDILRDNTDRKIIDFYNVLLKNSRVKIKIRDS